MMLLVSQGKVLPPVLANVSVHGMAFRFAQAALLPPSSRSMNRGIHPMEELICRAIASFLRGSA